MSLVCGRLCRYPKPLSKDVQAEVFKNFDRPLAAGYCCSWRGGGFRDECKRFFVDMTGKFYRVPGFLATSLERSTAMGFIRRVNKAQPRILWCILVRFRTCLHLPLAEILVDCVTRMSHTLQLDARGNNKSEFRCRHANFVFKTEVEGEMEFLYSAYSVFKVILLIRRFSRCQCVANTASRTPCHHRWSGPISRNKIGPQALHTTL